MSERHQLVDGGWYDARLVKQNIDGQELWYDIGETETGKEYIYAVFEVDDEGTKVRRTGSFFLSERAFEYTLKKLRALGLAGMEFEPGHPDVMGQDLGGTVRVSIEHSTNDDGKTFENIAWVSASGGGGGPRKRLDAGARASFGARMKARAQQFGESAPATSNKPDPADDLPF